MQFSTLFLIFYCQQLPTYTHTSFSCSSFVSHFVFWPLGKKEKFTVLLLYSFLTLCRIVASFYIFFYSFFQLVFFSYIFC